MVCQVTANNIEVMPFSPVRHQSSATVFCKGALLPRRLTLSLMHSASAVPLSFIGHPLRLTTPLPR